MDVDQILRFTDKKKEAMYIVPPMSNGYGRKEKRNITIQRRSDGRFTILDEAPEKIFCGKSRVRTSLRIRYLPSFIWSKKRRKFQGYFVLVPRVLSLHNHPSF